MLDQGVTGLSTSTFPTWIAVVFFCFYPFWFTLGYETARRRSVGIRFMPILIFGLLLLLVPSIVESWLLVH